MLLIFSSHSVICNLHNLVRTVCSNPPREEDKVRLAFQSEHNNYRRSLATGTVDDDGGTLPGSRSLFMMSYNCELELQAFTVTSACKSQSNTPGAIQGISINYGIIRDNIAAPSDDKAVQDIHTLMTKWTETRYEYNFNKTTVIYGNKDTAPFARIVYNKSISLGCTITQCAPRKTAYACAYSNSPVIGEPLYWPSKKPMGCTSNSQCRKAIPGSTTTCGTSLNLCSTNLLALSGEFINVLFIMVLFSVQMNE
ncbi:SCP-like protein [Necator americanus]|uniref:SCP-like protein n=1 Tax=Necator americanus TaxID=51031 RepID=W2STW8_NECAM|nr:SCP-like protein [Necator americanus]ETN73085.1 SCP-like protein [Necator americanus]